MECASKETALETLMFYARKIIQYKHHFMFLTACREINIIPHGLRIKKTACIQTVSDDFDVLWDAILQKSEYNLLLHLQSECSVIVQKWHADFYDLLLQLDYNEIELLHIINMVTESISSEETDLFVRRIHKLGKFTNLSTERVSFYVWDRSQFGMELKKFQNRILNIIYQTISPIALDYLFF